MSVTEYRLTWESPSAHECAEYEAFNGRDVWRRANWDDMNLTWHATSVTFTGNERFDQYRTLRQWAETHEQPIRNVSLEQREIVAPDDGWSPSAAGESV